MTRRLVLAVAAAAALIPAVPADAHAMDEVLQQVYLVPAAGRVGIEVDLTPGATVAAAFARFVDTDGDRSFGPGETTAHMAAVGRALSLFVDGAPVPITVTGSSYPDHAVLAAGGGTVTVQATATIPERGGRLELRDAYHSGQKTAVQMSVTVPADAPMAAADVSRADDGRTVGVTLTPRAPQAVPQAKAEPGLRERVFGGLRNPETLWVLIGICALLGAFHALTPGHGKTLLAAYLVGENGTPRQAFALGGVITATHTSSVLILGAAVLAAGHYVLPGVLVPALELAAGAAVLLLGLRIAIRRWRARNHRHDHHPHDARGLAAMGLAGGLVPCPEALSILILAVGLHHTALGLAMIVAFSAGLAAVLVGLGLVLVTARDAFVGLRPARHSVLLTRLPVVSAAIVVLLGVAMTVSGVMSVVEAS